MTSLLAEPPVKIFSRRYRALSVGLVVLMTLLAFEYLAVATAMPVVGRELDGLALYGLAFSGAAAASMIATVLGGRWSDVRGPVVPMWTGVGAFMGGLVLAGTAPTMDVFVAGRFVQGFGGGIVQVALYVLVARAYPAAAHPRLFSALATAWVVPAMAGPAVAGFVTEQLGWRWLFLGVPLLAAPAVLMLWRGLAAIELSVPETPPARTPIAARTGWAALAAAGAALMQYGGGLPGAGRLLLVAGLAMLAVALPRLLPAGTLRAARGLPTVIALRGLAAGAFTSGEVMVPLMLKEVRGLTLVEAGLMLTGGAVTWSFGSWLMGRGVLDRIAALRLGTGLIAGGLAVVGLTASAPIPIAVAYLAWALAGLGIGMVYPALSVLVLELSTPGEQGDNSASLAIGESVYTVVAVAATGAALAAFGTAGAVFALCFGGAVLMAAAGAAVASRVRTG